MHWFIVVFLQLLNADKTQSTQNKITDYPEKNKLGSSIPWFFEGWYNRWPMTESDIQLA